MNEDKGLTENKLLLKELIKARNTCANPLEEEGGIVMHLKYNEYEFIKIKNVYAGTATAIGLYEADAEEFSSKAISKMKDGWQLYASFHTHPTFEARPSSLDVSTLFQGFKYNFIYSPLKKEYGCCMWLSESLAVITLKEEELEKYTQNV